MNGLLPELSLSTQAFVRAGYGLLMIATLIQALPEARRFFLSERWGGYAAASRPVDALQNPVVMPVLLGIWIAAALSITTGWLTPWPALVNLVLCRYFFIHMRWKGVLRGMGAPGFIAYWTGLAVCLLEYSAAYAPDLRPLVLLVVQIDLAAIMFTAGVYKISAGYPRNIGMELGLCNPMWGYWWRFYSRRRPGDAVFWILNQLAWSTEVGAALLMVWPSTRMLGGLAITLSFLFILTQIRLGFLCEMVALAGLLYVTPGSAVDRWLAPIGGSLTTPAAAGPAIGGLTTILWAALWMYLALLPVAYAGLYLNFYGRRTFPGPLQRVLERYTNAFGMILWRVFSVDLVNFFIRVYRESRDGAKTLVSPLGSWPRFNHVGEMICLTSLFTTLKYYPNDAAVFRTRVLRYARTIPREAGDVLLFEYSRIVKAPDAFRQVTVAEYRADVDKGTVEERLLDQSFSPRAAHAVSPVFEGATPGSYAPARR